MRTPDLKGTNLCGHGYIFRNCRTCNRPEKQYPIRHPKIRCATCQDSKQVVVESSANPDDPWAEPVRRDCPDCVVAA